jgi:uncharacterized phiE125 gp8 family phage protein
MTDRFRYRDVFLRRVVITPPTDRAVTISEVRERLRLGTGGAAEDADLTLMIDDAQIWFEQTTGLSLMPQEVELWLSGFPVYDTVMPLMYSPIRSIDSIKYWNTASPSVETDLDSSVYQALEHTETLMRLKSYPATTRDRIDAVKIRMSVGFADAASVPADIKNAILLHVGTRYRYREDLDGRQQRVQVIDGGSAAIAQRRKRVWGAVSIK